MGGSRGLGDDAVNVAMRALDDLGAQNALRTDEMRAIDARVALCVC